MATIYTIEHNGEVFDIEGPDNATESDLMAAIGAGPTQTSPMAETPLETQPSAPRSLSDRAANLINAVRSGDTSNLRQLGSDALTLLETPGRGIRGLTVGLGQLGTKSFPEVVQRAAEATQPEFKPQNLGEKAASFAGTMTNLALPVGGTATGLGKTKAGRFLFGPSRLKAGQALGKAEEAAGLAQEVTTIPTAGEVKTIVKQILPAKDPQKLKTAYETFAKENPQGLKDVHDTLKSSLDIVSPKALARTMTPKPLTKAGYARLAANEKAARDALNSIVPGRAKAAEDVALAIKRGEYLVEPIKKYAKKAAIGAILGAGGGLGYKLTQ